jgi:hypothetical protein
MQLPGKWNALFRCNHYRNRQIILAIFVTAHSDCLSKCERELLLEKRNSTINDEIVIHIFHASNLKIKIAINLLCLQVYLNHI